ncbi:DMT family transporter [Foliimonas ilicis]
MLLGGLLIGCSPIFVRLSELDAVSTAFWRLTLALLPLAFLERREARIGSKRPSGWREIATVSLPGVVLGAELALWHISLHLTSVANSTLLVNLAPVFVVLYSWLVLGKAPKRIFVLALAATILGVVLLQGGSFSAGASTIRGDAIALSAAVLYAAYVMMLEKARKNFSAPIIMMWSTSAAAVCILPFAWTTEPALLPATIAGWSMLFGLSWVSQAGGQSLIAHALAWLPASFSSLTLLLQPAVAGMLAWIVLGEALTLVQCAGGAIILAGIWTARRA